MNGTIVTAKRIVFIGYFIYKAASVAVNNVKDGKTVFGKKKPMSKKTVVRGNKIYIGTNDAWVV